MQLQLFCTILHLPSAGRAVIRPTMPPRPHLTPHTMPILLDSLSAVCPNQVSEAPAWAAKNINKVTVINVYGKFAANYSVCFLL